MRCQLPTPYPARRPTPYPPAGLSTSEALGCSQLDVLRSVYSQLESLPGGQAPPRLAAQALGCVSATLQQGATRPAAAVLASLRWLCSIAGTQQAAAAGAAAWAPALAAVWGLGHHPSAEVREAACAAARQAALQAPRALGSAQLGWRSLLPLALAGLGDLACPVAQQAQELLLLLSTALPAAGLPPPAELCAERRRQYSIALQPQQRAFRSSQLEKLLGYVLQSSHRAILGGPARPAARMQVRCRQAGRSWCLAGRRCTGSEALRWQGPCARTPGTRTPALTGGALGARRSGSRGCWKAWWSFLRASSRRVATASRRWPQSTPPPPPLPLQPDSTWSELPLRRALLRAAAFSP